ncbi:hypothetical protein TVAG_174050 [Trichomonas vaginalis G3]|uniref:Uncharacterized protein n=1 Tax=Trichomonas vaginalis (strain ATCC PRA-98 / G3) TaxID=412133 RepID=A2EWU8_TRIV3|nr:Ankyrin repeat family [Trichomonas vaginalis G3]EAY02863.1 hypothetical protein TVAG_174050 [Trichomonas vaginalis G3]KAI5497377.1 Ankyrin repeat family [Trichomonas vaginalis G3]|eukprot:XP_001315086.1 hypothetical protein [Trichomonas vaginalis G3]
MKKKFSGKTALNIASENNSKETAEAINELSNYGEIALHIASRCNCAEIVEILLLKKMKKEKLLFFMHHHMIIKKQSNFFFHMWKCR